MTIGYLQKTATTTINANGIGIVKLGPEGGQFWAPNFVRIATSSAVSYGKQATHAVLYQGPPGVRDATTFMDETYLGGGDVSSVPTGTVVQYGEFITVVWFTANPGDIAVVTVYGRVADTLPEIATVLGLIPGARFSGYNPLVPIDSVLVPANTYNLTAGNSQFVGSFDVGGAAGLRISATPLSAQPCLVSVQWVQSTKSGVATTSDGTDFIVPPSGTTVDVIVPVMGASCIITLFPPSAAATSIQLFVATSRQQSGMPHLTTAAAFGGVPVSQLLERSGAGVGAGATDTVVTGRTWIGKAIWEVDTNAATWEATLKYSDMAGTLHNIARYRRSSANPEGFMEVILPGAPITFTFLNSSGAGAVYNAYLVGQAVDGDF